MNRAEHAFAGASMRDRIVGALETGCRLGEMLKIQNRHVLVIDWVKPYESEHVTRLLECRKTVLPASFIPTNTEI